MWTKVFALFLLSSIRVCIAFLNIGKAIDAVKACLSIERFSQVSLVIDGSFKSDADFIDLIELFQKNQYYFFGQNSWLNTAKGSASTLFVVDNARLLKHFQMDW
jgi:hypothetical protein